MMEEFKNVYSNSKEMMIRALLGHGIFHMISHFIMYIIIVSIIVIISFGCGFVGIISGMIYWIREERNKRKFKRLTEKQVK